MTSDHPIEKLMQRMFAFDEKASFDSYPTTTCVDDALIAEAFKEHRQGFTNWEEWQDQISPLSLLCECATQATTFEQLVNAKRYIAEYVRVMFECAVENADYSGDLKDLPSMSF